MTLDTLITTMHAPATTTLTFTVLIPLVLLALELVLDLFGRDYVATDIALLIEECVAAERAYFLEVLESTLSERSFGPPPTPCANNAARLPVYYNDVDVVAVDYINMALA